MRNVTIFDDHNDLFLLFYKICSPVCLFLNGLAVYLIIFKSSREMMTYRWHLLHYQILASVIDIFHYFLFQPLVFFPFLAVAGHGFLITNLGISTFTCTCVLINLMGGLAFSIVDLFFYRQQCIARNKLTKRQFYFFIALAFIVICFGLNIVIVLVTVDPSQRREMLEEENPWTVELLKIPNVYYLQRSSRTTAAAWVLFVTVLLLVSLILFFVCHIIFLLRKQFEHLSVHTRKMQRKFLTTLILQVTVPFIFLFIPIVLTFFRFFDGSLGVQILNNITMMMVSSYGIVATLCLIYFNTPYREFLFRRLKRKRTSPVLSFTHAVVREVT